MTWPLQRDCATFYGNPDPDGDGAPNRAWEDENLTRIVPPFPMVLAWDVTKPLRSIRIHKKCAASLSRVLDAIAVNAIAHGGIEKNRIHLFGGSYSFRVIRGGTRLSMHSYGCAIDLDPANNPLGRAWRAESGMMPQFVVDAFDAEGWVWGGRWARPDAQHFQAARVS